jgi:CBS domain-containing protein
MKVANILDRKGEGVVTIDVSLTLQSAADLMMRRHIAALVVTDGKEAVGLISERDIVSALARKGPRTSDTQIGEVVNSVMLTVSTSESLKRAMAIMTRTRARHLPVMEDGELIGIVSLGDMVKHRLEELELESSVLRDLAIAVR